MGNNELILEPLHGETFNQRIVKITDKTKDNAETYVRKEASFYNKELIKEIKFLTELKPNLRGAFPKVLRYRLDKIPIYYEMSFYQGNTLSNEIIKNRLPAEICVKIIEKILVFMNENIFTENLEKTNENYYIHTDFERIEKRYREIGKINSPIRHFIEAKEIILEGRKYRNIHLILNLLKEKKDFLREITPHNTHMIHGDFHFGNILVTTSQSLGFILIDPRGEKGGFAFNYDLGKLWFSFHGKYALIKEGLFELNYKIENDKIIVDRFVLNDSRAKEIFEEIYNNRGKFLEICKKYIKEDKIEEKILFSEAMHFCAIGKFNMKNNGIEKEGIGRYLTGVKLLNEFVANIL